MRIQLFARPWSRGVFAGMLEVSARFVPYTCLGVFDAASSRNPSISALSAKAFRALDDVAERLSEGVR